MELLVQRYKSNARDITYFITIYLQTDMTLMCQYTTSAIKTTNSHVSINLTKNLKILNSKRKPRSTQYETKPNLSKKGIYRGQLVHH